MRISLLVAPLALFTTVIAVKPGFNFLVRDGDAAPSATGTYGDCRDSSCPGGTCVSSNPSDSTAGYICSFPSATSSAVETATTAINDCRTSASGCPGGSCVSSNSTDPSAGYICSFSSAATHATSSVLPTTNVVASAATAPTTLAAVGSKSTTAVVEAATASSLNSTSVSAAASSSMPSSGAQTRSSADYTLLGFIGAVYILTR